MHPDVISEIVNSDLCVGCGLCAGVCPSKALRMAWQDNGDRIPCKQGDCPPNCDLCLRVCPFNDQPYNENALAEQRFGTVPGIRYHEPVGYYLSAYVGYSTIAAHRVRGASGGMCTWMLETLLNAGQVDAVACVGRGGLGDTLFTYQAVKDIEKVRTAAGSRYYPVDIADVVRQLQAPGPDKKYAIVGLPCTLKGLRLAMAHLPRVRKRVALLLGLVCGHLPNRFYTEYLARLSGVIPDSLETADYRLKKGNRVSNYYFQAHMQGGTSGRPVPFLGRVARAWGAGYFQYNACNYCDDIFAETADTVFMDAWLPEYENDSQGHSLIVVRLPKLKELFDKGAREGTCCLEPIPIDRVVASQEATVYWKKVGLSGRLYWARQHGKWVPRKRVSPSSKVWRRHWRELEARYASQRMSKELWPKFRRSPLWRFHLQMWKAEWPLRVEFWRRRLCKLIANPWLLIQLLPMSLRRRLPENWQQRSSGVHRRERN